MKVLLEKHKALTEKYKKDTLLLWYQIKELESDRLECEKEFKVLFPNCRAVSYDRLTKTFCFRIQFGDEQSHVCDCKFQILDPDNKYCITVSSTKYHYIKCVIDTRISIQMPQSDFDGVISMSKMSYMFENVKRMEKILNKYASF